MHKLGHFIDKIRWPSFVDIPVTESQEGRHRYNYSLYEKFEELNIYNWIVNQPV